MLNELIIIVLTFVIPYVVMYFTEENRYIIVFIENCTYIRFIMSVLYILLIFYFAVLLVCTKNYIFFYGCVKIIIEFGLLFCFIIIFASYIHLFIFRSKYRNEQFFSLVKYLSDRYQKSNNNKIKDNMLREISSLIEYMLNHLELDMDRSYNVNIENNIISIIETFKLIDKSLIEKIKIDTHGLALVINKLFDHKYCTVNEIKELESIFEIEIINKGNSL